MTDTAQPVLSSGTFTLGAQGPDPLTVRRLGFGAMRITGAGIWGDPPDHDTAISVLRRSVELGVDFIDTADAYGPDVSEDLIREALHPYDGVIIATKGGLTRQGPDQWEPVGRPAYLRQCVQMSLRRLGVERIDLWQLHRIDPHVPMADQFGEIAELQREGLIRHVGLSEVSVDDVARGERVLRRRQRAEPLQRRGTHQRGAAAAQRGERHRLHPVVPARGPRAGGRRTARWPPSPLGSERRPARSRSPGCCATRR